MKLQLHLLLFPFDKYLAFVACLLCIGCKPRIQEKTTYELGRLANLEAVDLSEDRSILSTHNDEIILSWFILETVDSNENNILQSDHTPLLFYDSLIRLHQLNTEIRIEKNFIHWGMVICLIEQDDEASPDAIHSKLEQLIKDGGVGFLKNRNLVDQVLGDNDYLGYKFLPRNSYMAKHNIKFSGKQLFDDYEYLLKVQYYPLWEESN